MNRSPSAETKALAFAMYDAATKTGAEQEAATFRAAELYEVADAKWAERYVRSCLVAQGKA